MRITDQVLRETSARYRALGSYAAVGQELGLSPSTVQHRVMLAIERGLIKPRAPKNPPTSNAVLKHTHNIFERHGRSGAATAKALRVSKTVVYRRLEQGAHRGLFLYRGQRNEYSDAELVEAAATASSIRAAARRLGLTDTHLHHLLTKRDLRDAVKIVKDHIRGEGEVDRPFIRAALARALARRSKPRRRPSTAQKARER